MNAYVYACPVCSQEYPSPEGANACKSTHEPVIRPQQPAGHESLNVLYRRWKTRHGVVSQA